MIFISYTIFMAIEYSAIGEKTGISANYFLSLG